MYSQICAAGSERCFAERGKKEAKKTTLAASPTGHLCCYALPARSALRAWERGPKYTSQHCYVVPNAQSIVLCSAKYIPGNVMQCQLHLRQCYVVHIIPPQCCAMSNMSPQCYAFVIFPHHSSNAQNKKKMVICRRREAHELRFCIRRAR